MGQSDVGIRISADAAQARATFSQLGDAVKHLNEELKKAEEAGDTRAQANIMIGINNASQAQAQQLIMERNAETQKNQEMLAKMHVGQQAAHKIVQTAIGGYNTAVGGAQSVASGDPVGGHIGMVKGFGQLGGSLIGGGIGAAFGGSIGGPAGAAFGAGIGSSIGGMIGGMPGDRMAITHALVQQYEKAMPDIDAFYQRFGEAINSKTAGVNSKQGLEFLRKANEMADDTGLTVGQLMSSANTMARYGMKDGGQALAAAKNHALWSRFTGADMGSVQAFAGTAYRYGGDNGALGAAYGGLMATGMATGQFDEFLNSMRGIMEEGIAAGFVRGADEIAGNMNMLYKLSGANPLWQGEQGARRLSQMNSAIAGSTDLASVSDVINYSVAKGLLGAGNDRLNNFNRLTGGGKNNYYTGTYADVMQVLERGVSPEFIQAQFRAVNGLEGGDVAGAIERYREMFGLNYTGASQVYRMSLEAGKPGFDPDKYVKEIKDMQIDPKYQSDSTLLQNAMNTMNTKLAELGSKYIADEIKIIETMAGEIKRMADKYLGTSGEDPRKDLPPIAQDLVIPAPAMTGYIEDASGNSWGANYHGTPWGTVNEGPDDYKAQMSRLMQEIAGPYNINDENSRGLYGRYEYMKSGKYGQDTKLDSSEVDRLIPFLLRIANATEGSKYAGMTEIELKAYITGK